MTRWKVILEISPDNGDAAPSLRAVLVTNGNDAPTPGVGVLELTSAGPRLRTTNLPDARPIPEGVWSSVGPWRLMVRPELSWAEDKRGERPAGIKPRLMIRCPERGIMEVPLVLEPGESVIIGRDQTMSNVTVADRHVSASHLRLAAESDGIIAQDLESRHGSTLNGTKLSGPCRLKHQDLIIIGRTRIEFIDLRQHIRDDALAGETMVSTLPPEDARSETSPLAETDAPTGPEGHKRPAARSRLLEAIILLLVAIGIFAIALTIAGRSVSEGTPPEAPNGSD